MVATDVTAHSLEAERAVLGAILSNNDALHDVLDVVTPLDFFRVPHQQIYRTMLALSDERIAIDLVTLTERLKRDGALEGIGGPVYVSDLAAGVPRSTNARHYAATVLDLAERRRLEDVAGRILEMAREAEGESARELIDNSEQLLFALSQRKAKSDFKDGAQLAAEAYALLERLHATNQHVTGIATGFDDFDAMTKGLQPGTLTIVAARPSMGKTSFALNLAYNAAEKGHRTAFYSLEMSSAEISMRLLSSMTRVDSHRLQAGYLSQTDYTRVSDAMQQIAQSRIHVDDSPDVSLMDVRGKTRRLKAKHGLALVVLDYLQLMQLPRAENRNIAVGDVSRGLKLVARELELPMVVLSQLSRESEKRGGDKKPMLSDLRDSGALEQDADLVVFIHRPEVYDPTPDNAGLAELVVAKQRNGPTGTVKLSWLREITRFENWSGR